MYIGAGTRWRWCVAALVCGVWGEGVRGASWQWPGAAPAGGPAAAPTHRIDTKVRFDDADDARLTALQSENENSVLADEEEAYAIDGGGRQQPIRSERRLAQGEGPPGAPQRRRPEYYNEVEERPLFVDPSGPRASGDAFAADSFRKHPGILVGPQGPTGNVGPPQRLFDNEKYIDAVRPAGIIAQADVNVGSSAQRGVLVGPGGPTGIIGPGYRRPVLVGPGGPTGIIGPNRSRNGILVGPGGPTGITGPYGYGGRRIPGVLVGPGGPTGVIGPRPYYGK